MNVIMTWELCSSNCDDGKYDETARDVGFTHV